MQTLYFKASVEVADDEAGTGVAIVYDEAARDLDGMKLRAEGITWDTPVAMLWQHDQSDPGNVVGSFTALERDDTRIVGTFRLDLSNERARKVRDGMKAGTIREFSVGFAFDPEDVEKRDGVRYVTRSELIEVSAVVKGANTGTRLVDIKRAPAASLASGFTTAAGARSPLTLAEAKAAMRELGIVDDRPSPGWPTSTRCRRVCASPETLT